MEKMNNTLGVFYQCLERGFKTDVRKAQMMNWEYETDMISEGIV